MTVESDPAHRRAVDLPRAYRLLNHGPTVLVSVRHGGRANVMAAAWAMPLDFDPPKIAVVIDRNTFTRGLVDGAGQFALNVPCRAQADAVYAVGSTSGAQIDDKFATFGLRCFPASRIHAPLVDGCVAWLECRVVAEPHNQKAHDLFIAEVVAAQADTRVFTNGRWHFGPQHDALRTLHHLSGGAFFVAGDTVQAHKPGTASAG